MVETNVRNRTLPKGGRENDADYQRSYQRTLPREQDNGWNGQSNSSISNGRVLENAFEQLILVLLQELFKAAINGLIQLVVNDEQRFDDGRQKDLDDAVQEINQGLEQVFAAIHGLIDAWISTEQDDDDDDDNDDDVKGF